MSKAPTDVGSKYDWVRSPDAARTPPVIEKKQDEWYFNDEGGESHGPYDHENDARQACRLYTECFLRGDRPHVTEEAWNASVAAEDPGAIHPCGDWRAWECMCVGACSCHSP